MRIWLLAYLLAACTPDDVVHHLPPAADAGTPDPTVTPDPLPDPLAPVAMSIRFDGVGVPGIGVYFQGPDDAMLAYVETDASGRAEAIMPHGGSVTIANPYTALDADAFLAHELRTWVGVEPGDQLQLDDRTAAVQSVAVAYPAYAGAEHYQLDVSGCGRYFVPAPRPSSSTGPAPIGGLAYANVDLLGCAETVDLTLTAYDELDTPLASFGQRDVAIVEATATLAGTFAPVAIENRAFTDIPADATALVLALAQHASNDLVEDPTVMVLDPVGGEVGVKVFPTPIYGAVALDELTAQRAIANHEIARWGATDALDVGATLMPDFTSRPSYDLASRTLAWTTAPAATTPQFVYASLQDATTERLVIAPYTGSQLVLPALPDRLADFAFASEVQPRWVTLGASSSGFAAIRGRALDVHRDHMRLDIRRWLARTPAGRFVTATVMAPT